MPAKNKCSGIKVRYVKPGAGAGAAGAGGAGAGAGVGAAGCINGLCFSMVSVLACNFSCKLRCAQGFCDHSQGCAGSSCSVRHGIAVWYFDRDARLVL